MAIFHHHPDNIVYIRTQAGTYSARVADFISDLGGAYDFVGKERLYEPGARHFVDNVPQELEWAEGDGYIAAFDALMLAKNARENPPLTLEQYRQFAREVVKNKADIKALELDDVLPFDTAQLPLEFIADELNRYEVAGRPANPAAAQYKIGAGLSVVRGETVRESLEWMRGKWLALYVDAADLIAQRFDYLAQVNAAADAAAIVTVLAAVEAW